MPSSFDKSSKQQRKGKIIKSAFDSETFDRDVTIHVDGLVGSATISPCGRDVALASPEGLAIIDVDSPYSPPRRLSSHGLPWLVVDVQWSPFPARDYWIASTANHRCLVWNLNKREDSPTGAIEHSLEGHTRAITDINFSGNHPDMLSTCAVDGYVHCWDLRRPRKPVLTFSDWFAGATQVKYNRQDEHILASSHDRWLHIWDDRKANAPLKTITAHTSKIYGVDWSRIRSTAVVTCSVDRSIKCWDYSVSDEPERIIRTDFPVWRARHTPFGWGILAMPQNDPGHLYLYDKRLQEGIPQDGPVAPVQEFQGHGNCKAREFLWRARGDIDSQQIDGRDFQLVSWGEDNELRLCRMDPRVLEAVGHKKGQVARAKMKFTRQGAVYKTFRSIDDHSSKKRRTATISDPHFGSGAGHYRRSALTTGISSLSSRYPRIGTGPTMKASSATGKKGDRSREQLGWMKGITMSRKRATRAPEKPQRKDSKDSTMFGFHDSHWEEPETLQEEIIRVNQQLPNVHWENVDMEALALKARLEGPWGADGATIWISVKVDIPSNYPHSKAPRFAIGKSAMMDPQAYKKLESDVNELANSFAKRKRNCLEVAFTFLLGETDLSASSAFFKNVKDFDDDLDGLADESSSDDDDDEIPAGGSASMSQELTASTELDPKFSPMNRTSVPALPRLCGARFTNDGRLVCFFPSKEEQAKALFLTPPDSYKDRPKGEPNFAGFGRLQPDSGVPRRRFMNDNNSATEDQSDSEYSDDSSSSSSDNSETTYMHKINMWYLPGKRFKKTFSGTLSLQSSDKGTGGGTGTGTGTSRRRNARSRNIITIQSVASELPSQKELAQDYIVFGDGADICDHNALAAQKHGRGDLVDVWRYASLLLRKEIPLEFLSRHLDHETESQSVLVIARDAIARFGHEPPFTAGANQRLLSGRVRWGRHPLANELISHLFDYYEGLADVQMLAMLSCVFSDSNAVDSIAYAESRLTQPETPLPMKAPAFSLEYLPTEVAEWTPRVKSRAQSGISTPRLHTPAHLIGSYGSAGGLWAVDSAANSYPREELTPSRTPREHLSDGDPTHSLSTSPNNRLLQRANSALSSASVFAASLPRHFNAASSTSPPSRKRPSPGEAFLNNLAPTNIPWGPHILGPSPEALITARNSVSDDEIRREDHLSLVCYGISTKMEDQSIFDDDGWQAASFLDGSRTRLYSAYRHIYAGLLQTWGHPLARLEVMKFNVLNQGVGSSGTGTGSLEDGLHSSHQSPENTSLVSNTPMEAGTSVLPGKKENNLKAQLSSGRGIEVTGICWVHETHLEPLRSSHPSAKIGAAVGTCERCKHTQTQLLCVYCREPVDTLYPACLTCGCASHDACLAEWYAAGETECPAGDECDCLENACEGQVETWAAMIGALQQAKRRKRTNVTQDMKESTERDHPESSHGSSTIVGDSHGRLGGLYQAQEPLSAAKISLGNRLKRSAGTWGSATSLRKKSGTGSALGRYQ